MNRSDVIFKKTWRFINTAVTTLYLTGIKHLQSVRGLKFLRPHCLWDVTTCSLMYKYQRIGGSCWLDLQDRPISGSEILFLLPWRWRQQVSLKRLLPSTRLYVTFQKTQIFTLFSQNIPRNISLLVKEFIRGFCVIAVTVLFWIRHERSCWCT